MKSYVLSLLMILTVAIAIPTESHAADLMDNIVVEVNDVQADVVTTNTDIAIETALELNIESLSTITYTALKVDTESPPQAVIARFSDGYLDSQETAIKRQTPFLLKRNYQRLRL